MNQKLKALLESLLNHIEVMNGEIERLGRCEQFSPTAGSLQLIEQIRGACMTSLQNLRTVERRIYLRQSGEGPPPGDVLDFPE